ncbi:hypothetical protein PMZ80_008408 [Knufia obscura]|uniref:Uncharacterized protein n=2 Tax=Knufia TaxID=430999 RepID=A0AAN8EGZ4_9EURO|nr:hypothetical protein PMZ80_008408 [Knufia obscura]KAK5951293.1 hypothetical protein OHC33_007711 [Knufia fluminis]
MASTSWWNPSSFTASEGTFNTTSLPQNISAYFKRPAKVTKPSSRNQSPRTGGRRRMTTHLPARTRSVADAQRPNMNARQQLYRNAASSRPISWHPNLVNEFEQYQMPNHQFYPQSSNVPMNTTFAHGLVTPYTYPVAEPYFDCPNVPLEQMTGQDLSIVHSNHQAHNVHPYVQDGTSPEYTPVSTDPYQATDFDVAHMAWPSLPPSMPQDLATAPTSPDFLPVPDFGQSFCVAQTEEVVDTDELVGMGLYDSPAQVQSASLSFNGPLPVRRKSLKLEESFEPALQSDDGDDDAESEPTQQDISAPADHYQTILDAVDYRQGTEYTAQYYHSDPSYAQNPPQTMSAPFASGYPDQQGMMNGAMYNWF